MGWGRGDASLCNLEKCVSKELNPHRDACTLITNVPKAMLFLSTVIGKGGEQINKLQSETGARVQVAPGLFVTN